MWNEEKKQERRPDMSLLEWAFEWSVNFLFMIDSNQSRVAVSPNFKGLFKLGLERSRCPNITDLIKKVMRAKSLGKKEKKNQKSKLTNRGVSWSFRPHFSRCLSRHSFQMPQNPKCQAEKPQNREENSSSGQPKPPGKQQNFNKIKKRKEVPENPQVQSTL